VQSAADPNARYQRWFDGPFFQQAFKELVGALAAWSQNLGHEQVLTTLPSYGEVARYLRSPAAICVVVYVVNLFHSESVF
jgi:hypothetical protein